MTRTATATVPGTLNTHLPHPPDPTQGNSRGSQGDRHRRLAGALLVMGRLQTTYMVISRGVITEWGVVT